MRTRLLLLALLTSASGRAAAQASIFDIRGLGIPQAPLSARAVGMGGSVGLLDGLSATNPAAITSVIGLTAGFNFFQNWRSSTTPGGTGSASDAGLPLVTVVNRVRETPWYFSGGFGSYTNRDFGVVTVGTTSVNGIPVQFKDSLQSLGGTSDLRLAVGYRRNKTLALGVGLHFITGSNRFFLSRTFSDSVLSPVRQRSELAYNGIGVSVGAVYHPIEPLLLAGVVRRDGTLNVDRDSLSAYTFPLPWTFGGSAQYQLNRLTSLNAEFSYVTWSLASQDIVDAGGIGAEDTFRGSIGGEMATSPVHPGTLPLRAGLRYAQLPFPLADGEQPSEFAVAAGTGARFAKGHAAIDVALERVWRSSSGGFSEKAWILTFGLTLKP
ncbi:MAG TPA: hypothetical protein VFV65_02985 [Gemmatimonadales bacterium]|nr:hypothetical protein [Gemmatimonadales bacterium]